MVYGCFMDWEAKTEKICFLGGYRGGIGDVGDPEGSDAEILVSFITGLLHIYIE